MASSISALAALAAPAALAVLARFREMRALTTATCATLSAEDQMVQSCPEASPAKWHQAHTTWFFETFVLSPHGTQYQAFHPDFYWLFNSYYRSLGEEIPEKKLRASFSRPSVEMIREYRAHVERAMERLLRSPDVSDAVVRLTVLGVQHEQQHLELLLTDIKHAFYTNPLHPVYREGAASDAADAEPERWVDFTGGLREIGYRPDPADPADFCFDNETPRHTVFLQPYALANRTVTCAEYLDFMDADGYSRPELWLSEGWDTCEREDWRAPLYWQRSSEDSSGWRIFTLGGWHGLSDMLHTPVCHLSFFEADAFARWRGCRLPTEAEWENACTGQIAGNDLLETGSLHPKPASGPGLSQMLGGCWEWTASPYTGYPGYRPLPGALGEYNGKFMSSQIVLRGGSCATPVSQIHAEYRNFFSPSTRWQFSGIRLARAFGDL